MNPREDVRGFIAACCLGSEPAWNLFFDIFHPLVSATVRRMGIRDAEDAIQSTYLKLIEDNYRLLKKFRGGTFYELLSYVRKVTLHTGANYARAEAFRQIRQIQMEEFIDILATSDSPESLYLNAEFAREIQLAVAQLDLKYREPVYLVMQGYKHREIADILNMPIDSVSTRIRRAYQQLQKKMAEKHSSMNEKAAFGKHYG